MTTLTSTDPHTGQRIESFETLTAGEIEKAIGKSVEAFQTYRRFTRSKIATLLYQVAQILEKDEEPLAQLITFEMGKTISASKEEIKKCAWNCRYYADAGPELLADERISIDQGEAFVRFDPLGPVLAIMPWNFPFWQVFRFAAPALMGKNTVLLKHASNVPQCSQAIEEIFKLAGFPEGVFQSLLITSSQATEVLEDSRIAAVTLTGSLGAGSKVASIAGKQIKKSVLELGGSDPFIVMPSAKLSKAIQEGVKSRMLSNGQSCIAAKRFILHSDIAEEFIPGFVKTVQALKVGDPKKEQTEVGPLASEDLCLNLEKQVNLSIEQGAKLLCGGKRMKGPGFYFEPTVLIQAPEGSPAFEEELFGPVASLFIVQSAEEAIELANRSEFGLGASVWTQDEKERKLFMDDLQTGTLVFNEKVASDPRLPFGGIKKSGYGRELGQYGLKEFTNIKTIKTNKNLD